LRREIFIESLAGTNWVSSRETPLELCSNTL